MKKNIVFKTAKCARILVYTKISYDMNDDSKTKIYEVARHSGDGFKFKICLRKFFILKNCYKNDLSTCLCGLPV